MFQKLEKVVYVDNVSLCDESKCGKISENKLHQTSKLPMESYKSKKSKNSKRHSYRSFRSFR